MAEKSSIFQTVQIGVEATPGSPVQAARKLTALSIVPGVKVESDSFTPAGMKYPTFAYVNKEWVEAKIEGRLTYNEIAFALASLLYLPTPQQQGATAAYKWVFSSNSGQEDQGITLSVEQGDETTAWRSAGLRVSGLEFEFSRDEITLGGSSIGLPLETGIVLTANPTSLTPRPVLPAHVRLKMASTRAGLDTAPNYCRAFSLKWGLTDKVGMAFPLCAPFTIETQPNLEYTLKVDTGSVGIGLIETMRNGDTKWFRLIATGGVIDSPHVYTFQIDFPAQIVDVGEFSDSEGVYMVEYTMTGIHDVTWGKSFEITLLNEIAEIAPDVP